LARAVFARAVLAGAILGTVGMLALAMASTLAGRRIGFLLDGHHLGHRCVVSSSSPPFGLGGQSQQAYAQPSIPEIALFHALTTGLLADCAIQSGLSSRSGFF
jgi:hypothetical protein